MQNDSYLNKFYRGILNQLVHYIISSNRLFKCIKTLIRPRLSECCFDNLFLERMKLCAGGARNNVS